jgi:glycerol uptake facilitator-like aquaporin
MPMNNAYSTPQQLSAEFVGTAMLLCAVIGSGIMAQQLAGGNMAVALLANTLATVFALYVLIEILGPISGAHFNPLVTLWSLSSCLQEQKNQENRPVVGKKSSVLAIYLIAIGFIVVQLAGAVCGAWLAHAMFDMSILQTSSKLRGGVGQWIAEAVATAGLIFVIARSSAQGVNAKASALVACYIGAAYWFTASTSFANPAAVMGRMMSDSFAGIAPASAVGFVVAQIAGAVCGAWLSRHFNPKP